MLCSRSASLMTTMRQSSAIAMNMERRFSACSSAGLAKESTWLAILGSLDTLVSPSTSRHTVAPKTSSTSARSSTVSSTVSCSRPAAIASRSISVPAWAWAWGEAEGEAEGWSWSWGEGEGEGEGEGGGWGQG